MTTKRARKKKAVTVKAAQPSNKVTDAVTAPVWGYEDLMAAYNSVCRSETHHYVERIEEIIESKYVMSDWEQKEFDRLVEKYNVKYKSPLSKALK